MITYKPDETVRESRGNKNPHIRHLYFYSEETDSYRAYCGKMKKRILTNNVRKYPLCIVCDSMYKNDPFKMPIIRRDK